MNLTDRIGHGLARPRAACGELFSLVGSSHVEVLQDGLGAPSLGVVCSRLAGADVGQQRLQLLGPKRGATVTGMRQ